MNKTVLVVGSGPIIIGQAAEFDYAGAQACKSLREEGYRVVLINSNPATIMTDTEMADRIYIEPITPEIVEKIIIKEKPFGILGTLGGQTGLNLTSELNNLGILEKYKVEILGTDINSIETAEDRDKFRSFLMDINQPAPPSIAVNNLEDAKKAAKKIVKKMGDKGRYDSTNQTKTLIVMQVLGDTKTFFDSQQQLEDRVGFFTDMIIPDTKIEDNNMAGYFLFVGSDGLMNQIEESQWQN